MHVYVIACIIAARKGQSGVLAGNEKGNQRHGMHAHVFDVLYHVPLWRISVCGVSECVSVCMTILFVYGNTIVIPAFMVSLKESPCECVLIFWIDVIQLEISVKRA